jgi:hypothetical protein
MFSSDETAAEQFVVVHPDCRPRMYRPPTDKEGMGFMCAGCIHSFQCTTGNVDDGSAPKVKPPTREELVKQAQSKVDRMGITPDMVVLNRTQDKLREAGLTMTKTVKGWQLKFKGTIWSLDDKQMNLLAVGNWLSSPLNVIQRTITKNGIDEQAVKFMVAKRCYLNK